MRLQGHHHRILRTGYLSGARAYTYGENIGFGTGPASSPRSMMRAWMNSTPHTTATRFFFPERYAESEAARSEVKKRATEEFRGYLERVQKLLPQSGYWLGERVSFLDAYAFTLFRWGGFAGIDPRSLAAYHAYAERILRAQPLAVAAARERIALDTYKG